MKKNAAGIESNCEKATEDHKGNFTQKRRTKGRYSGYLRKHIHNQILFYRRLCFAYRNINQAKWSHKAGYRLR